MMVTSDQPGSARGPRRRPRGAMGDDGYVMTTTEDSGRVAWLRQARSRLRAADPVLARLIDERPDFDPRAWIARFRPPVSLYDALLWQVAYQQLSVAAAERIVARTEAVFGGASLPRRAARHRSRAPARGRVLLAQDRDAARPRRAVRRRPSWTRAR